jgi:hypothetical protein
LAWARALKVRCAETDTAFFFKQLGSEPTESGQPFSIPNPQPNGKRDVHGKAVVNFPEDLRTQEWPDSDRHSPLPRTPSLLSVFQTPTNQPSDSAPFDKATNPFSNPGPRRADAQNRIESFPEYAPGLSSAELLPVLQWV